MRRAGLTLQAEHHGRGVLPHDLGVFGIAFIGPAPANVAYDGERGSEAPVESGNPDLASGDLADLPHEAWIAGRA